MRLFILSAIGALAAATPALADESGAARVELRGGIGWIDGQNAKGAIGAAAGYDWNLGSSAFVGVEQSADKVLIAGEKVRFATSGRIGANVTGNDKLYATAGYAYGKGPNAPTVGAGWEHGFGGKAYGKVEYKHYFNEDGARNSNAALVGVGVRF